MSLPDLLERAAARPSETVDVDGLWQRGRRRRRAVQVAAGGGVAAVAVSVALALSSVLSPQPAVVLVPPGPLPESVTAAPLPALPPTPTPTAPADWPDLTLAEALDRLITVNETAPVGPADGLRVTRSVGIYSGTDEGGHNLTVRETRWDAYRTGTVWRGPIAEGLGPETTPERLREIVAATDLDALELELEYESREMPPSSETVGSPMDLDDLLARAEEFASPQPLELDPDRTPHTGAAGAVDHALTEMVPSPQQRIRALRILAGLNPSAVEYGGVVRDLLGREGIGIVLLDLPLEGRRRTLIFSPDTGEQLGTFHEAPPAVPGEQAPFSMTAVLSAEIRPQ